MSAIKSLHGVVEAYVDAVPGFAGGPVPAGSGPERIALGKSERQEGSAAKVNAAGVDVGLSHLYLTASVTDSKPTVFVKGSRGRGLSGDHSC